MRLNRPLVVIAGLDPRLSGLDGTQGFHPILVMPGPPGRPSAGTGGPAMTLKWFYLTGIRAGSNGRTMAMDELVSRRNCESVYEIGWLEYGETDEGTGDCEVCGMHLASWR